MRSRPTWARGLKLFCIGFLFSCKSVAPHVGAWIETLDVNDRKPVSIVAPHVGAWIETKEAVNAQRNIESRPTWARGLKLSL